MFKVFGMSMQEFLRDMEAYSTRRIKEALEEASEEAYFLDYEYRGMITTELVEVTKFINALEIELEMRRNSELEPSLAQVYVYDTEYGFVAMGRKVYPFVSIEQCKAIIQKMYTKNLKLTDIQLVGRGKYKGTLLKQDVQSVLQSLS